MIFHSQQKHSILAEPRFGAIVKNLIYKKIKKARLGHLAFLLITLSNFSNEGFQEACHFLNADQIYQSAYCRSV